MSVHLIEMKFSLLYSRISSLIFLLCCSVSIVTASPESTGTIKGNVIDDQQLPLYPATVILYQASSGVFVEGTTTNDEGAYTFSGVSAGEYFLSVAFIGFETYKSEPFAVENGRTIQMPVVELTTDAVALEGVSVQAERDLIEVQPDKTVLNIQGTVNAAGNTAFELLRKSPGVVVDNNDNVILSGKSGVQIYIDGKPSPLSTTDLAAQLKTMQASEIDAIEIITNPSAKYDAEGNAGIINIRLRRDKSLGANSTVDLSYGYGDNSRYSTTATFNYRTPKLNTFGSYAFSGGQNDNWINLYRIQNDVLFDQQSETGSSGPSNRFRMGTDIFLGDKSIIGFMFNGYINDSNWLSNTETPITDLLSSEIQSVLVSSSDNDGVRRNANGNLNYRFDNKKGITSNADIDIGFYYNGTATTQPNLYLSPGVGATLQELLFTSQAPTDISIYSAKLDHERPVMNGTLGVGAKISQVGTENSYDYFQVLNGVEELDIDRSNQFDFVETIGAGYFTFTKTFDKFTTNLGLRGEWTFSSGELTALKETNNDTVERRYLDLFPSGGITYSASQKHQFRLNYSRRVDRPSYQALNPFEFKLSELSYSRGNPFLQPQYTNNVSFTHTYNYVLNTTISYSHTNDFFANISDSTEVNRTFLETINLEYQRVLSANISYPFSPTKWWSTYSSVNGFHKRNKAELTQGRIVDIATTTASLYHQSTFSLPKDWAVELSGWYSSPSIWGAVYETDTNYSIDTGVRKKFAGGKATLKVSVTDVFNTASWRGVQRFPGLFVDASGGWESRQLRLNFSYFFGNDQVKKARNRKSGIEAEANRIGN
ncbi:MAG: TonB-dependent receptor [Bacteroidota bacterium]